jgi:hypothetical protein
MYTKLIVTPATATINRWENARTKSIKIAQAAFASFCASRGIKFDESEGDTRK